MITGDNNWIALAVGAAHDADMAVVEAFAREDGDGADARTVELLAVIEERARRARLRSFRQRA